MDDNSTRVRIGQRLKELRELKGLSQLELSNATGIPRCNIARMERGVYNQRIDLIDKIATALDAKLEITNQNIIDCKS